MAIDPNIILQGQAPKFDPLAMAGQVAQIKNALIANQSNQQQLDARQAIGPIYQGAIDPSTGQLDTNKLLIGASQDPRTAWMAGDIVKSAQDRAGTQVDIDTKRYALLKNHIATLQQGMAPLIANPNATPDDYLNFGKSFVREGLATPQELEKTLQTMPQGDPNDPAYRQQLHNWGIGQYTQLLDTEKQLDALYGKPQQTNTGGQIQQGTESAMTGYHPQGAFQLGLSPSEAAATQPTVGPNGQPGVISKGAYAAGEGIGQGAGAYIPANGQPMGAGEPQAPAQPTQGQPAAPAPHFMPTGLAPGQSEALTDSATQGQAALKAGSDYRLNVRPLLSDAKNQLAQGVLTGPNADTSKLAGQFAAQFGIELPDTKKQEVLSKVLEQIAQRQTALLGGVPTDAKLSSAQNASPNTHLSSAGLAATLATVTGQGQAIDMLGQAYNAYLKGNPPQPLPFNQFRVQFSKDIDPYVLILRSLPAHDEQEALRAMKPAQRAEIAQSSAKLDRIAQAIGWQP